MKVLHLFANHKRTGPAELALEAARAVAAQGVEVRFFSSDVKKTRTRDRWLQILAREREVPEAELSGVRLPKHISPLRAFLDVRKLRSHLRAYPFDLIHCHLPGDHLVAGLAARPLGIPIVRSQYDGTLPKVTSRRRMTLGKLTQRLVCHSHAVAAAFRERAGDYGLDPGIVQHLEPLIDTERFDPERGVPRRREALGVPEDAFCIGIVARMQTHRRFEVLLQAMQQAHAKAPQLQFVIVGRGTNQETVARQPVRDMGMEGFVHFAGYVSGEEYVGTLASFDAKVFMVPGSDGTCRAVREALSMGMPVITTRRGILPELAREGIDGMQADETADDLARAFVELASDRERAQRMGEAARAGALERFTYERFGRELKAIYESVLSG